MPREHKAAERLAERFCRPQRVGIFGHRGVGKTTLLTMLYREAVGGRLPGLRLAAADPRTADYLSEKILHLEAGQPLPATLAETELRFHLYQGDTRLELLVKDYQGEHIELDRDEPIREFLRDCDAVWLCLDAPSLTVPDARLRRQQEVERLIEDYLAAEPQRTMERPVALVLTKADLLGPDRGRDGAWAEPFDMARHALATHCPHSGLFPVSSLGGPVGMAGSLSPAGLVEPLVWLVESLRNQDEARLEQLWSLAARDLAPLARCVAAFARRYPQAGATAAFQARLQGRRRQRRRRQGLLGTAAAACLILGLSAYDALGYHQARRFESDHPGWPAEVLERWQQYQAWHPTRHWLQPGAARQEETHLTQLTEEARRQARTERLAELSQRATDPDADPDALWQQYHQFHADFPEVRGDELDTLRTALKTRRDHQIALQAQRAFDDLDTAEKNAADLPALIARAERFLHDYPESAPEAEVRRRLSAFLLRLDERDIEAARAYSARQPLNFQTRREHYQQYLDKHPAAGAFRAEAEAALKAIDADWDRHDFRTVRDQFQAHAGDIPTLVTRCRAYLAAHPAGRFRDAAEGLLRWSERITVPGEYRVVLRNGQFDGSVARFFSRGPKLSVELEVAGVRYGPSTIIRNRYDPDWNFEYARRVRWKLGDPVVIRVTEHSWKDRVVMEVSSADGDPLALKLLTGEVWSGPNRLTFQSDFALPILPAIE